VEADSRSYRCVNGIIRCFRKNVNPLALDNFPKQFTPRQLRLGN
jgi:hypothetical protein